MTNVTILHERVADVGFTNWCDFLMMSLLILSLIFIVLISNIMDYIKSKVLKEVSIGVGVLFFLFVLVLPLWVPERVVTIEYLVQTNQNADWGSLEVVEDLGNGIFILRDSKVVTTEECNQLVKEGSIYE